MIFKHKGFIGKHFHDFTKHGAAFLVAAAVTIPYQRSSPHRLCRRLGLAWTCPDPLSSEPGWAHWSHPAPDNPQSAGCRSASQPHRQHCEAQANDRRTWEVFTHLHWTNELAYKTSTTAELWCLVSLPWERPAAQLLYKHLAAILNSSDICALSCVIFTPVPFLFDWRRRKQTIRTSLQNTG